MPKRQQCSAPGCGLPGEVVRVRSWLSATTAPLGPFAGSTTVWCLGDARSLGYEPDAAPPVPPPHLNAFQRWVVKALQA